MNHIQGESGDVGEDVIPTAKQHGPVQVIVSDDEHQFELDEKALETVLLQDDIKDLPVAVVSVAGAFRKGKSFILDFFLRYLKCGGKGDWLGSDDVPLEGFTWRGGAERDTTGILFWSEVFKVITPSGEEIAVLLVDTQGAFDSQSTVRDCATIFALSTMTSSVQIYNLSQNIQEDDLQHLQLFTEYGRLALEDCSDRPFQKLMFLVRDWSYPYESPYGIEGGEKILERRLLVSDKQHHELQSLRKHIRSCFSDISCFLMPHPGLKVATNPNFDGRLSEIESDFKKHLLELVPLVLSPRNLVVKQIGGQKVKAKELVHYFKAYTAIYKGNELPEPKSMLEATAEANNLSAVSAAKDYYTQAMEEVCGGKKPYLNTATLEVEHMKSKRKALEQFSARRKMGGEEFSLKYVESLEREMEDLFSNFRSHNEGKNIMKSARTPAVLFIVAAICYVLSGIFGILGMYSFANMFNLIMGVKLLLLAMWAYVRYSGDYREVGTRIDSFANVIWDYALKPVSAKLMAKGIQTATNEMLSDQGIFRSKLNYM
ncbi:unnamed protein product [Allacma fusca]|uniref:GB1/RHD3-type G domain-containing protein n=1 Tax=Allacma fusca TaxID=39272 RepID=A0A8J2K7N2_9HEXA|nr:unnamed protein product [Allacma fusca]